MVNIFCLLPNEEWFCDRYGREYKTYSEHDVTFQWNGRADCIWLLGSWCWRWIPSEILASRPVVCTVHHIVPEKFDQERQRDFAERDKFVDLYHVPCLQTFTNIRPYTQKPIVILDYWLNNALWRPMRESAKEEFELPHDMLVVSSFQRDTEGSDLKTPKLEKGPDLFCDHVEMLAEKGLKPFVLLNGWRRQYVMARLDAANIPYQYHELPKIHDVVMMYNATDLYVVGSRYEGGPQAILEAAATRTPIISTQVGIADTILPPACIMDVGRCDHYMPTEDDVNYAELRALERQVSKHVPLYDDMFSSFDVRRHF